VCFNINLEILFVIFSYQKKNDETITILVSHVNLEKRRKKKVEYHHLNILFSTLDERLILRG